MVKVKKRDVRSTLINPHQIINMRTDHARGDGVAASSVAGRRVGMRRPTPFEFSVYNPEK
jgi:hypothetical protein